MSTTYMGENHVQSTKYNEQFGCLSGAGFKHYMQNISEDRLVIQFSIDSFYEKVQQYGVLVQNSLRQAVDFFYTFSNIVGYLDQGELWVVARKSITEIYDELRTIIPEFLDFSIHQELWKGNTSLIFNKKTTSPLYSEIQEGIIQNKFTNKYQPIFDKELHVVGSETLVRWQDHSHVGPETFLEAARNDFLLELIEDRVWKNIIYAHKSGYLNQTYVTVNVSAERFQDPEMAEKIIHDLIDKLNIHVVVEITEHLKFDATNVSKNNLQLLKEHGVEVFLDDFGTGYSGLDSLLHLHIDGIKIDKRFVDGLPHMKESQILCGSILQLAQSMSVKTVAEGIESKEQLDWLIEHGCQYFQGYYLSQPLTASELSHI